MAMLVILFANLLAPNITYAQDSHSPYLDQRSRREEYLNYISSRCRSLHELSNQRYKSNTSTYEAKRIQEARRSFEDTCQEEVSAAQEKAYKNNRSKRDEKHKTEREEQEKTASQERDDGKKRQQCLESRRIIAKKRERTDLTPGELQDLARFEENVQSRCPAAVGAK